MLMSHSDQSNECETQVTKITLVIKLTQHVKELDLLKRRFQNYYANDSHQGIL